MKYKTQIRDAVAVLCERFNDDNRKDHPVGTLSREKIVRERDVRGALEEIENEVAKAREADSLRSSNVRAKLAKVADLERRLRALVGTLPKPLKLEYAETLETLRAIQRTQFEKLPARSKGRPNHRARAAVSYAANLLITYSEWEWSTDR